MIGPFSLAATVIARCSGGTQEPSARRRKVHLGLEMLERRIVLSGSYTWTGGGYDGTWDDPANWSGDVVPPSGSAVTFSLYDNNSLGIYIEKADVSSITIKGSEANVSFMADPDTSGASLTLDNNATIWTDSGATLSLSGGLVVNRDGNVTATGSGAVLFDGATVLTPASISPVASHIDLANTYEYQYDGKYGGRSVTVYSYGSLGVGYGFVAAVGSLDGGGNVALNGGGATLEIGTPADESDALSGSVEGSGTIEMDGTGTLTIGSMGVKGSTDNPDLEINSGTIIVEGEADLNSLDVGSGATFGDPGIVNVSGSAVFQSGSTFEAEIDGPPSSGQSTQLTAGSVQVQGATLALDVGTGYQASEQDTFPVISTTSKSGVSGTFAGVSTTVNGFSTTDGVSYTVGYGSSSITLQPQAVKTTTTVSLDSSTPSPSTYGQKVKLDATVAAAGGQTPTGTVTFYDGKPGSGGIAIGSAQALSNGQASVTTTTLSASASPHSIYAVYTSDTTSDFSGSTSSPASVTIKKADLTVTGVTANNKVYDGTTSVALNTSQPSFTGLVSGDSVGLAGSGYTATVASKTVGNNKAVTVTGLTLTGAAAGNYTLTQPTGLTANITPRPLTATGVTANNKPYDQTVTATLTIVPNGLSGVVSGDNVAISTSGYTASFADKNVGTGKSVTVTGLTLTGTAAGNYTFSQPTGLTASITPVSLQVTGLTVGASKPYDGTTSDTLNTSAAKLSGVLGSDVVQLVNGGATASFADKNVGTDKTVAVAGLSLTGAQASNYTLAPPTFQADITPITLAVTAAPQNMTYGGQLPPLTYTVTGLVPGDTVASALSGAPATIGSSRSDVGNYPITQGTLTASNYTIQFTGATLSIAPATLTIAANDASMTAGGPLPALTVSYSGFVNGDMSASLETPASVSTTATASSPAGTYPITASGATSPNYAIVFQPGTLTVVPPQATVHSVSIASTAVQGATIGGKKARGKYKPTPVILVQLSGPIDAAAAQDLANYTLATVPRGKKKSKLVALSGATWSATTMTVTLTTRKPLTKNSPLRLTINAGGLGLSGGNIVEMV